LIAISCAAAVGPALADPLAELEEAQTALYDAVAPAVVVVENGAALGAGFAVAPGLVVTAAHVVLGAEEVRVTFADGQVVRGAVIERARDGLDLAVVRVPLTPARTLPLLPGAAVRTGAFVAAVGHGDGSRWTLATGIVANAAADGPDGALVRLQLPLRPGASGGPVVDRAGGLVGVVTHGGAGAAAFAVRASAVVHALGTLGALAVACADQGCAERPTP
jgi:S1-C subfamily serine protease